MNSTAILQWLGYRFSIDRSIGELLTVCQALGDEDPRNENQLSRTAAT